MKCCNLPTLTLPPGPEALDIFHGLLWEQMVTDEKEQGSQGFWSFGSTMLIAKSVCVEQVRWSKCHVESQLRLSGFRLIKGQKKSRRGLMPKSTNSRCLLKAPK